MPITDTTRAIRMGQRLLRTAESKGGDTPLFDWLHFAHDLATAPRTERFDDDHEPTYLHPGRSALILMMDLDLLGSVPLGLALWHDSEDASLEPNPEAIGQALDQRDAPAAIAGIVDQVLELSATLPRSGDEDLAERLVVLDHAIVCAALAERLDHLRHLHLRDIDNHARDTWREARDVWLPVAQRTHPELARRYAWWTRKFTARYG